MKLSRIGKLLAVTTLGLGGLTAGLLVEDGQSGAVGCSTSNHWHSHNGHQHLHIYLFASPSNHAGSHQHWWDTQHMCTYSNC